MNCERIMASIYEESGGNDCSLQTKKTEINILNEKSSCSVGGAQSHLNSSTVKTAMDLSYHTSKTIFEEADYFARNFLYKLMPITLEAINETIIRMEHNYCNFGPFAGENFNKTIHIEAEERNYKKRKSKSGEFPGSDHEVDEKESVAASVRLREGLTANSKLDEDYSMPIQPLDLSLPVFQDQKTEKLLKENMSNIRKTKSDLRTPTDLIQFNMCDSNKENVTSSTRKIEVTISRPGEKEYYQPCEMFLNDVARIIPDLVKNDCHEIEIIDRTNQDFEVEKSRIYYIVSESAWHAFENSSERIILTNDLNIGEPIPNNGNFNKPTYVIFDRYSLTGILAKMCEKKGGSFEYTCLEESVSKVQETRRDVQDCGNEFAIGRITMEEENWKNCEEKKIDTEKIRITETNILKRLLCEQRNIKGEKDTNLVPEVSDKSKMMRLETEEKISGYSRSISTGANVEEGKPNLIETEPQVPSLFNQNDALIENCKKEEKIDAVKMETENSELESDVNFKFVRKDEKVKREMTNEIGKEFNKSQKSEIILEETIGKEKIGENNWSPTRGSANFIKKREKMDEENKLYNRQIKANSSTKRITRSNAPEMNEGPEVVNLEAKKRRVEKKTRIVQSSGNGKETMQRKKLSKMEKAEARLDIREGTKKTQSMRESSSMKTVGRRGRSWKKKSKEGFMSQFKNENSCFDKRETRSTAKKRAAENIRRTRLRKQEQSRADVASANLSKSCIRRR